MDSLIIYFLLFEYRTLVLQIYKHNFSYVPQIFICWIFIFTYLNKYIYWHFKLENNCFTVFCWFLPTQQHRSAVCVGLCLAAQLCLILCDPMDCIPQAALSVGFLQARILESVAMPFSRGTFQPRNWTGVSCIAGGFFTSWATICTSSTSWASLPPHCRSTPLGCDRMPSWASSVSF